MIKACPFCKSNDVAITKETFKKYEGENEQK